MSKVANWACLRAHTWNLGSLVSAEVTPLVCRRWFLGWGRASLSKFTSAPLCWVRWVCSSFRIAWPRPFGWAWAKPTFCPQWTKAGCCGLWRAGWNLRWCSCSSFWGRGWPWNTRFWICRVGLFFWLAMDAGLDFAKASADCRWGGRCLTCHRGRMCRRGLHLMRVIGIRLLFSIRFHRWQSRLLGTLFWAAIGRGFRFRCPREMAPVFSYFWQLCSTKTTNT